MSFLSILRAAVAVITILISLFLIGFAIFSFSQYQKDYNFIVLGIISLIISGVFGIFSYHDYLFYFGKK